jgi:branched-chain amino acid transport system permease protein
MEFFTISLLNGVSYGLLLFMLSSGLTLIFSMMGVLNFAHASFYMLGAYFAYSTTRLIGFWPALFIAPLLVALLGAAFEKYCLRRVHKFGHVPELLITFGLSFIILEMAQLIWGTGSVDYRVPAELSGPLFTLYGTQFPLYRGFMMLVAILMLIAIWLLLTRTRIGLVIQAALTHPETVEALGHNVPRVFMLVFGGGAGRAGGRDRRQRLRDRARHGGHGRLGDLRGGGGGWHGLAHRRLRRLVADRRDPDLRGRHRLLPDGRRGQRRHRHHAADLRLRAVETQDQPGGAHPALSVSGPDADLPAQGPARHAGRLEMSTPPDMATTTPAYYAFKPYNVGRWIIWSLFAIVLLVAPLVFTSSLSQTMLSQMGIAIIVCLSYNMLLGQGGMLSFGHAVYSGMGSFLAIHTLNLVTKGLPLPVSLIPLVGGVSGMLVAVVLGWVTTKKAATPFAMITLGVGELVWAMALMFPEFFGGEGGISSNRVVGPKPLGITFGPQIQLYYLIALYTFVCTALMYAFTRTPLGRMLNAVRDNPERVEFVGYDTQRVRYIAFVIAAFFAGISGGLAALNFEIVTSEVVSGPRSGAYLLFTFLGGATFFFGPIIGAILMVLAFVLLSELTKAWLLYLGLVFLFMVMYAPGGIASLIMMNLRVASFGRLKDLWVSYIALALTALVVLFGAASMIEMVYHLQLNAALGPELRFLGASLNAKSLNSWFGAGFVMLTGIGLFELARRQFVRQWGEIQQYIETESKRREAS